MLIINWTKEEEEILKNNYQKYGAEYCSNLLRRPIGGVRKRAKMLKLKYERIKIKYHEENLKNIIILSNSIGETLDKLNLRRAGGNYGIINNYIKKYNIDISHFDKSGYNINDVRQIRNLEDVLVENSNYSRTNLKKRLYNEGILERKCCLCNQDENWNGMKISLVLDHINGVYNDNRVENLRIVCPNCNAGLDTFAGRNSKK
jgi:hypothetical protein